MSEKRYLRKSVGRPRRYRIKNVQIRKDLGQEPVTNTERKGLRWFGHVASMSEDRKQLLEARQREKEEE